MLYQYYHKDIKRTEMQIARTKPTFIFLTNLYCTIQFVRFVHFSVHLSYLMYYAALCPPKISETNLLALH